MAVKDRSKIIDRIRVAMAIADNPSSSEQEREQATRTVSKLIAQYQIEMAEIRDIQKTGPAAIVNFTVELSNRYSLGGIRARALAQAVVQPMGGTFVYWHNARQSSKEQTRMEIFLSEDVADAAKTLIASLILQVETTMAVAVRTHRRELADYGYYPSEIEKDVYRFRQSYLVGWGKAVSRRVLEGREEARVEASSATGKEIALVDDSQRSHAAKTAKYSKLTKARRVTVTSTGMSAGARDGRRADIGLRSLSR